MTAWRERITSIPDVLRVKSSVVNTPVPAALVLGYFVTILTACTPTLDKRERENVVLDLSKGRQLDRLQLPEGYYEDDLMIIIERPLDLTLKFQDDKILRQHVNLLTIFPLGGQIRSIDFRLPHGHLEEIYARALEIADIFDLQTERLTEWYRSPSEHYYVFDRALPGSKSPMVTFSIRRSFDPENPWLMDLNLGWVNPHTE